MGSVAIAVGYNLGVSRLAGHTELFVRVAGVALVLSGAGQRTGRVCESGVALSLESAPGIAAGDRLSDDPSLFVRSGGSRSGFVRSDGSRISRTRANVCGRIEPGLRTEFGVYKP